MVYANLYNIDSNGKRVLSIPDWVNNPPPSSKEFFLFWLAKRSVIPELTYCVRSTVFKKFFPVIKNVIFNFENPPDPVTDDYFQTHCPWYKFEYNFIKSGYLPKYLPFAPVYSRLHNDARNNKWPLFFIEIEKKMAEYISELRKDYLSGNYVHHYRDGNSRVIGKTSKNSLLISRIKIMVYRGFNRIFYNSNEKKNRFEAFIENKISIKRMLKQSVIFRSSRFMKHYYKFMLRIHENRY